MLQVNGYVWRHARCDRYRTRTCAHMRWLWQCVGQATIVDGQEELRREKEQLIR